MTRQPWPRSLRPLALGALLTLGVGGVWAATMTTGTGTPVGATTGTPTTGTAVPPSPDAPVKVLQGPSNTQVFVHEYTSQTGLPCVIVVGPSGIVLACEAPAASEPPLGAFAPAK